MLLCDIMGYLLWMQCFLRGTHVLGISVTSVMLIIKHNMLAMIPKKVIAKVSSLPGICTATG